MENNNRIFDKLDRIEEKLDTKLDKIEERIDSVEKELIVYNAELTKHIEGVTLAREENKILKNYIDCELEKFQIKVDPIVNNFNAFKTVSILVAKIVGVLAAISSILYSIHRLFYQ